MKKLILFSAILCSFLFTVNHANAQQQEGYTAAAGLKFGGFENGISIKYFTASNVALEGIIGFRSHGVVFTGLYEIHQQVFNVEGLNFYYGAGAHLGSVGAGVYKKFNGDDRIYNSSQILLGADGVLGLEYVVPNSPIAVSLDLNPRAELATGPFFDIAPGLGVKYTF